MLIRSLVWMAAAILSLALCACSETPVCPRGATQPCACADARQGAQICSRDGMGWGPCQCVAQAEPPAVVVPVGELKIPEAFGGPAAPAPPAPTEVADQSPVPSVPAPPAPQRPEQPSPDPMADPFGPDPAHIEPSDRMTTPSRDDLTRVLRGLADDVAACGNGEHGLATVRFVINGTGRVRSADVSGSFAGTPVGSCIARVARRARFPTFAASTFTVSFPYRL